jgi:rod shape-determining protein RodA
MATYRPPSVLRTDWINPAAMLALAILGVLFIKSGQAHYPGGTQWQMQLIWLILGAGLYFAVSVVDYHLWMKHAWLVYLGCIVLLLLLWTPLGAAGYARANARRWLGVGSYTIQPSEFAKVGTIIMLSFYLDKWKLGGVRASLAVLGKLGVIVGLPMVLIFLQPDLGSSLALCPTVFALLYVSNLSARFFVTVFGLLLAGLVVLKVDTTRYENFVQTSMVLEGKISADEYNSLLEKNHAAQIGALAINTRRVLLGKMSVADYNQFLQASHQDPVAYLTVPAVEGQQAEVLDDATKKVLWAKYYPAVEPFYISGLGAEEKQVLQGKMSAKEYDNFLQTNNLKLADRIGASYQKRSWLPIPLKDYQRDRIASFLDAKGVDPDGIGVSWNQNQSLIAVGTGGLTGKGYEQGTQARLGYLPPKVATSDFIMAVFLEETGFIGGLAVLGLYAILLGNTLRIAWLARERFGQLLCVGVAVLFMVHVFVNIGMVQGLVPVKGIPLPFMSYGGSFVLSCCILMGLVQSVYRHCREAV